MTEDANLPERFDRVTRLGPKGDKVLQSIRFQDQDQSTKAGAVLTFSGLLIATSLVQFNAAADSIVHLAPGSPYLKFSALGLLFLFVSSLLSLLNMVVTRHDYSSEVHTALFEFERLVGWRRDLLRFSVAFCAMGTFLVLVTLFIGIGT